MFLNCVVIFIIVLVLTGCNSTVNLSMRRGVPLPSQENMTLIAGAGKADITPRPGLPMAGYSLNANYGKGFRTRLYARAIYLKSPTKKPIVLVQCDLLSGSEIVHRRVAELVSTKTDVDVGGIVLSGTHTHSGPGNLAGSNFYLSYTGNSGGLDLKFFNFMTARIADAIIDAYNNRAPARLAYGSIDILGFTRNRNIESYRLNTNADVEKAGDIRKAVNPRMHMIRIDCLNIEKNVFVPTAAFTSFSIHGTSVPSRNELYNADLFAYVERELEWEMMKKYEATNFVHALVNGTHADSAPDVTGRLGFEEARRLGTGIGRKAIDLFNSLSSNLRADAVVQSAIREIDHYKDNVVDNIALCDPPRIGTPLLAGVKDGGDTPILKWLPFFKEGSHRWIFTGGCHGSKRVFAGPFQSLFISRSDFPHVITYQAVQIGEVIFLPLPYEITMESGNRIAEACRKSARKAGMPENMQFVVVSVSNGYTGYCTTPEEYEKQLYEGGHTIYGPNTSAFIAAQTARLTFDLAKRGEVRDMPDEWSFSLRSAAFYQEYPVPEGRRSAQKETCAGITKENPRTFLWADVPLSLIDFHRRLVSVECSDDGANWMPLKIDGIQIDDDCYDMSIMFTGKITGDKMAVYEVTWNNPEKKSGRLYRFRIEPRHDQEVFYSDAFN